MDAAEIVLREVQRDRHFQVQQLLAERRVVGPSFSSSVGTEGAVLVKSSCPCFNDDADSLALYHRLLLSPYALCVPHQGSAAEYSPC